MFVSLFGALLLFSLALVTFNLQSPGKVGSETTIAGEVKTIVGDDWLYLSKSASEKGRAVHELILSGVRVVNPYNGYHFKGDFSCGKYYLANKSENATRQEIVFQNPNPEKYFASLEPVREVGDKMMLYGVIGVEVK